MAIASVLVDPNAASVANSAASVASTAEVDASTANVNASTAKAEADSAVGSQPGSGEFIVTDIKRDSSGSIVFDYNDSAITP